MVKKCQDLKLRLNGQKRAAIMMKNKPSRDLMQKRVVKMKDATHVINLVISQEIVVLDVEIVETQDPDLPHQDIIVDIVEIPDPAHHVEILGTEEITEEDHPQQEVEEIVEIDVNEEIAVDLDHQ